MKRLTPRQAFGLRIKELRTTRDLKQEELARITGLYRTYMSRLENGLTNPTFDTLLSLAEALRVPPAALFEPPGAAIPARTRALAPPSRTQVVE